MLSNVSRRGPSEAAKSPTLLCDLSSLAVVDAGRMDCPEFEQGRAGAPSRRPRRPVNPRRSPLGQCRPLSPQGRPLVSAPCALESLRYTLHVGLSVRRNARWLSGAHREIDPCRVVDAAGPAAPPTAPVAPGSGGMGGMNIPAAPGCVRATTQTLNIAFALRAARSLSALGCTQDRSHHRT